MSAGYFPASLLGYGDVGIPGLLVALSLKFDYEHRPKKCFKIYYAVSGIGKTSTCICTPSLPAVRKVGRGGICI